MPPFETPGRHGGRPLLTPLRLLLLFIALLTLYLLSDSLSSSPSFGTEPYKLHRRIVAVADLHGDLSQALSVLQMARITDARGQWMGSEHDVLVSTGDLVDRGDDTIGLYRLFDGLRTWAGPDRVKNCLGNHEVMNALGDWRYVTQGDIDSFGGVAARRKVMSTEGWIGQTWLGNYSVSHTISLLPSSEILELVARGLIPQDYVTPRASFVHGGIHPAAAKDGLAAINAIGHSLLLKALSEERPTGHLPPNTTEEEYSIWSELGPFWYRGYAYENQVEACRLADEARKALGPGVDYLVMGHTPHLKGFVHRCHPPSIYLIDTGISRAYGGEQSALIFETSLEQNGGSKQPGWTESRKVVALYRGRRPRIIHESAREFAEPSAQ